jgi:hypothetical protein
MSDKPLFENMDEQEATYAPEQLPLGSQQADQAELDEDRTGDRTDQDLREEGPVAVGAAGAATGAPTVASFGPTGVGGLPAVGPAIGGAALADEEDREDQTS